MIFRKNKFSSRSTDKANAAWLDAHMTTKRQEEARSAALGHIYMTYFQSGHDDDFLDSICMMTRVHLGRRITRGRLLWIAAYWLDTQFLKMLEGNKGGKLRVVFLDN